MDPDRVALRRLHHPDTSSGPAACEGSVSTLICDGRKTWTLTDRMRVIPAKQAIGPKAVLLAGRHRDEVLAKEVQFAVNYLVNGRQQLPRMRPRRTTYVIAHVEYTYRSCRIDLARGRGRGLVSDLGGLQRGISTAQCPSLDWKRGQFGCTLAAFSHNPGGPAR